MQEAKVINVANGVPVYNKEKNYLQINNWTSSLDIHWPFYNEGSTQLLPLLRARFGNMLDDQIISVELKATHNGSSTLEVFRLDQSSTEFDLISLTESMGGFPSVDLADLDGMSEEQLGTCRCNQGEAIRRFFELCEILPIANELGLFSSHYLALLARITAGRIDSERLEAGEENFRFMASCIYEIATHFRSEPMGKVVDAVVWSLKHQPPAGIFSDSLRSRWEELCVEVQGERSALWNLMNSELSNLIHDKLITLPRPELLTVWITTNSAKDWIETRYYDGDFLDEKELNQLLMDRDALTDLVDSIRQSVLSLADNDNSEQVCSFLNIND